MGDRSSFGKRLSDGFLPKKITDKLFIPIYKNDNVEINGWSLVHFSSGVLSSLLNFTLQNYILLNIVFETSQVIIEKKELNDQQVNDTIIDVLLGISGHVLIDILK